MAGAPVAPRKPRTRAVHGEVTVDEYYWLLDRDDPDTVAYLEAENAYTAAQTEHLGPLRERLFEEIKARVQETDLSVPESARRVVVCHPHRGRQAVSDLLSTTRARR